MSYLDRLIEQTLALEEVKKERVAQDQARKETEQDPRIRTLEAGRFRVIDGDTVWDENLGREVRVSSFGGSPDTYEDDASKYYWTEADERAGRGKAGELNNKFYIHKKAFAEEFDKREGFFRDDVTPEQLAEYGQVQGQRLANELQRRIDNGESLRYQITGLDEYDRALGVFEGEYFENLSRRENNAGYYSEFNNTQRAYDALDGTQIDQAFGREGRGLGRASVDQAVNFGIGALNILNDFGQLANAVDTKKNEIFGLDGTYLGSANRGLNEFFSNNRKVFQRWKENLTSDAQTRSERAAQKEALIDEELYQRNVQQFMRDGDTEIQAKFKASMDSAGNAFRNLMQSPGRMIDMTFESLPYMVGIAGVGRAAISGAIKKEQKRLQNELFEIVGEGSEELALKSAQRFLASEAGKKEIQRAGSRAATAAIGFSEGVSNAAAVYDSIMAMTPEQAMESEKYQDLILEQGLTHEQALLELANVAAAQTLGWTALLAGAAGKLTGVADWESKLLAPMARGRAAVAKATEEGTKRSIRQRLTGYAQNGGRWTVARSIPATQEAVEEAIQSGGGTAISQAAEAAAGFETGSGATIARAAVEGAGTGAVSGGGISTLGSVGSGLAAPLRKAGQALSETGAAGDAVRNYVVSTANLSDDDKVQAQIDRTLDNATLTETFQARLDAGVPSYRAMQEMIDEMEARKPSVEEADEFVAAAQAIRDVAERSIIEEVEAARKEGREADPIALSMAGILRVDLGEANIDLTPKEKTVLAMAEAVSERTSSTNRAAAAMAERAVQAVGQEEVEKGRESSVYRTVYEKFGTSEVTSTGKPGLGFLARKALTQVAEGKAPTALLKMRSFADSQQLKYEKQLKINQETRDQIEASADSSPQLLQFLEKGEALASAQKEELVLMEQTIKGVQVALENGQAELNSLAPQDTAPVTAPDSEPSVAAETQEGTPAVVADGGSNVESGQGLSIEDNKIAESGISTGQDNVRDASTDLDPSLGAPPPASEFQDEDIPVTSDVTPAQEPAEAEAEAAAVAAAEGDLPPPPDIALPEGENTAEGAFTPPQDENIPPPDDEYLESLPMPEDILLGDEYEGVPDLDIDYFDESYEQEVDATDQPAEVVLEVNTLAEAVNAGESIPSTGTQETLEDSTPIADMNAAAQATNFHEGGRALTDPAKIRSKIIQKLAKKFLPNAITEAFTTAGRGNLLSGVAQFRSKFSNKKVRAGIASALGLDADQRKDLNSLAAFINRFADQMDENLAGLLDPTSDNNEAVWRDKGKYAHERLREFGLHFFTDENGNVQENVQAALAAVAYKYLATEGAMSSVNTVDEIRRMVGLPDALDPTPEMLENLQRGSFRHRTAEQLGYEVLRALDLKFRPDGLKDSMFEQRMAITMGLTALMTLEEMGLVQQRKFNNKILRWKEDPNEELPVSDEAWVEGNDDLDGDTGWMIYPTVVESPRGGEVVLPQIARMVTSYSRSGVIFEKLFGVRAKMRPPQFDAPEEGQVASRVGRGESLVSSTLRGHLGNQAQHKYVAAEEVDFFGDDRMDEETWLNEIWETKDDKRIEKEVHVTQRPSEKGKRLQAERSLRNMVSWAKEAAGRPFHVLHTITSSMRMNMDSNVVNMQSDGNHRWFFRQPEWSVNIPTDPKTARDHERVDLFFLALGLGLDYDFSKGGDTITKTKEFFAKYGDEQAPIWTDMLAEKWTPETKAKVVEMVQDAGEKGHSFAAILTYAQYVRAKNTEGTRFFETSFPNEVDGKTNGLIALTLQTPGANPEWAKGILEPGGIFFEDTQKDGVQISNYPQFAEAGERDNYEKAGYKTRSVFKDLRNNPFVLDEKEPEGGYPRFLHFFRRRVRTGNAPTIIEGMGLIPMGPDGVASEIRKAVRNLAKNPLTVAAYMGGIRSIKLAMARKAVDTFYEQMVQIADDDWDGLAQHYNNAVAVANIIRKEGWNGVKTDKKNSKGKPIYENRKPAPTLTAAQLKDHYGSFTEAKLNLTLPKAVVTDFEIGIIETAGYGIQVGLEELLGPMVRFRENLNNVVQAASDVFIARFAERLGEERKKLNTVEVPNARRKEILQQMIRDGEVPMIRAPLSNDTLDALQITKDGKIYYKGDESQGKGKYVSNSAKVREINTEEATSSTSHAAGLWTPDPDIGVAAIVKAIHSTDGAVMAEMVGNENILGVHDAIVGNLLDIMRLGRQANARFFLRQKEYDLVAEIEKMANLVYDTALENSKDEEVEKKLGILKAYIDGGTHPTKEGIELPNLRNMVKANTETRNLLFNSMRFSNQFAAKGTEVEIRNGELVNPVETQRNLDRMQREEVRANTPDEDMDTHHTKLVGSLLGQTEQDTAAAAFLDHLKAFQVNSRGLVSLMSEYLKTHTVEEARPEMEKLLSILESRVPGDLRVTLDTHLPLVNGEPAAALYRPEGRQILVSTEAGGDIFKQLLHELVHAATYERLANDPAAVKALKATAREYVRNFENGTETEQAVAEAIKNTNSDLDYVAEYLAYSATTLQFDVENSSEVPLDLAAYQVGITDIADLLDNGNQPTVLGSSLDTSVHQRVTTEFSQLLTADGLRAALDHMRQKDGATVSAAAREMFDSLVENFIVPTLREADKLMVRMGTNPNAETNAGVLVGNSDIYIEAAGRPISNNGQESLEEVTLHEVMHGLTKHAINTNADIRHKVEQLWDYARQNMTWKDFLEGTGPFSPAEQEAAQRRWEHVFGDVNSPSDRVLREAPAFLHEFMAFATTNPAFSQALGNVVIKPEDRKIFNRDDLVETLGNILSEIFIFFRNLLNPDVRGREIKVSREVQALLEDITALRLQQEQRAKSVAEQINAAIDKGDQFAIDMAKKLTKALQGHLSNIEQDPNYRNADASEIQRIKASVKQMGLQVSQLNAEGTVQTLEELRSIIPGNNFLMEALSEVLPYPEKNLSWIALLRRSQNLVDTARKRIQEHTRDTLLKSFDRKFKMKPKHRTALTHIVMKTDLRSLLLNNYMTYGDIQAMLNNPAIRDRRVNELRTEIEALLQGRKNGDKAMNWIDLQTQGLANLMMQGDNFARNQANNAHLIVKQTGLDPKDRADLFNVRAELEVLVDQLTTLKAVKQLDGAHIQNGMELINHEMNRGVSRNGFTVLIDESLAHHLDSLKDLFKNNPAQMIKGYTYEVFDDNIDIEIAPATADVAAAMAKRGYKQVSKELEKDVYDPGPGMAIYRSLRGVAGYNKAVLSLTNPRKRGMDIRQGLMIGGWDKRTAAKEAAIAEREIKDASYRDSRKIARGQWVPSKMLPVYDDQGNISGYRYIMSHAAKREFLGQREYFDEVLPRMAGAVVDRPASETVNAEAVQLMKDEWDKYGEKREGNKIIKRSEVHFIEISPGSKNKEAREMWALLPEATKREARKQFGSNKLIIRSEAANLVLGFRKLSLAQGKSGELLGPAAPAVRFAETLWQEAMAYLRHRIAITTPEVVIGNVVSNNAVLLSEGIPAEFIIRESKIAIREMRKYQRLVREIDEVKMDLRAAKAKGRRAPDLERRYSQLDARIRSNPVHDLVEEGLFTSIVEDLGYDEQRQSTKLINKALDKVTSPIPGVVTEIGKEAFMVPGSRTANAALVATQMGDFAARYVKFKYDTQEKKVDRETAINDALAKFIYYNMPQNKYLQWANDNGFMMFTKFFFRIQPVVVSLFANNPARATAIILAQKNLMAGLDPVAAENVWNYGMMDGVTRKFEPLPWNHFTERSLLRPQLLEWVPDVFGE